jgi:small GTP-binding protein
MHQPMHTLLKKVCLLGDFSVGKTSLVRRFVEGRFDERYLSSIGVKVDRKVLPMDGPNGEYTLTLMLWDLAGGPQASPVVPSYYRGSAGAIIALDLTRPQTLSSVGQYAQGFLAVNPQARFVMAANKVDLVTERCLSDDQVAGVAAAHGVPFFLTSAKTGEQVELMFHHLGQLLVGT